MISVTTEAPRSATVHRRGELRASDAVAWFREAAPRWHTPSEAQVIRFTREINTLRKQKGKRWTDQQLAKLRQAAEDENEIIKMVRGLVERLPRVPWLLPSDALFKAAERAKRLLGTPKSRGPSGAPWAAGARSIAEWAIRAWEAAGVPHVSHQTKGGPVSRIVERALIYIEGSAAPDPDTIAKQLERTPPRVRQIKS